MEYRRYGKLRFGDYCSAWIGTAIIFVLIIITSVTGAPLFLILYALTLAVYMLYSIFIPNSERFSICDNVIITKKGRKKQEIAIPVELTLIVSYADLCTSLAKRVSIGNQTYMLKNKCAVSILQKIPLETALEGLHPKYAWKYTNTMIEECFDDYRHVYIYSFVCDQNLLDKLIGDRECLLIIPESLSDRVSVNSSNVNVYIDTGY